MNKKALVSALVLATVLLSGCEEGAYESNFSSESAVSSLTQSADNSTVSRVTSDEQQTGIPEEISRYIDSLTNGELEFVDYTFTKNPATYTDKNALGEDYDKALNALKATDDYKKFSAGFTKTSPQARFSRPVDDFFTTGSAEAVFKCAFQENFDSDHCDDPMQSFVLFTIAKDNGGGMWGERDYLVFVGDGGAEIIADYYNADFTAALDYGKCRQVIVDSEGWNGNDALSHIYGVNSGKAVKLYGGRLGYVKSDCFLYSTGPWFIGDFMVFDINAGEYLAIRGKELSAEDIAAMDGDKLFDKVYSAVLIGGKFFIINNGCFTYEDGKFVASDKNVRASQTPGYTGDLLKFINDVDYDAAVASMTTPPKRG